MGGRGGSGGTSGKKSGSALDRSKIERANGASVLGDAGDRIQRTYSRNVEEINSMSLSESQKSEAIEKQKELATNALETIAKNPNPYGAGYGPARINKRKASQGADKIASAENAIDSNMKTLRNTSSKNRRAQENRSLSDALSGAISRGDLSVTFNGKEYYRTRKNSNTWRVR